jgi:hypothetical protein
MGKSCALSAVERQKIQQWIARTALHSKWPCGAVSFWLPPPVSPMSPLRFADEGLDGLWDIASGRGRKPKYQIDKIAAIVEATLQTSLVRKIRG